MGTLALIILVLIAINTLTPGSIYKSKPDINYESPKLYIAGINFILVVILATLTIL